MRNPPPRLRGQPYTEDARAQTRWFDYQSTSGWAKDTYEIDGVIEPLYHATVSLQAALKELRPRRSAGRKGLGGGTSAAISFTQDRRLACEIARCLVEMIQLCNDKIGWDDLIVAAERDGVLDRVVKSWRGSWRSSYNAETNQDVLDKARRGMQPVSISGMAVKVIDLPPGAIPHPFAPLWKGGDDLDRTSGVYLRPATPEEDRESRFNFYRTYLAFAESAGKRVDPLFFMVDPEDFRGRDVADVGVIEARYMDGVFYSNQAVQRLDFDIERGKVGVPPGMFTYLPSMDEYRIYDTSKLEIVGAVACEDFGVIGRP